MPESITKGQPIAQLQGQKLKCFAPQHPFAKCGKSHRKSRTIFPHIGKLADEHVHHPLDAHRRDQPRPGPHVHEHRHDHLGPAVDGLVAAVRSGSDSRGSARLRGADLDRAIRPSAADRGPAVAQRLSAEPISGRRVSQQGRPVLYRRQSAGRRRGASSATWSTPSRSSNRLHDAHGRRSGNRQRASASTKWLSACRPSVPASDGRLGRNGRRRSTCTARKGADGSFAANCLLARRLAERGVRFIQLYHRDWDHHGGVKDEHPGHRRRSRSGPRPR